jgi:hypothetical protein
MAEKDPGATPPRGKALTLGGEVQGPSKGQQRAETWEQLALWDEGVTPQRALRLGRGVRLAQATSHRPRAPNADPAAALQPTRRP